jgi:hypothetical protein
VRPYLEKNSSKKKGWGAGGVVQMVELLPSKHEALSSNFCIAKRKPTSKNKMTIEDDLVTS